MTTRIYCFSGTGNSLHTARTIAGQIGGAEIISVRNDAASVPADDADVIGIVCPVYEWDIPGTMKSFAEQLSVNPDAYIFMIATYIAVHGRCFETMEKIMNAKGTHLSYSRAIRCVASQCIAYPPFPSEKIMTPYMERQITRISRDIRKRKERTYPRMSFITRRLYPKKIAPYMAVEKEYDKGFFTDDRCAGCGVCAKVCPTRNIVMENNRPRWTHHCHGCNACVAYCPTKAVQFSPPPAYLELNTFISRHLGLPEKRKRYHHPAVRAEDLMTNRETVLPQNGNDC